LPLAALAVVVGAMSTHAADWPRASVATLLQAANGGDPGARLAATRELFRRGPTILPQLARAGAKPMTTVSPPRGDVVYSLLQGGPDAAGATQVSFGLHVDAQVTAADIASMGSAYGFRAIQGSACRPELAPACYVQLLPGKRLPDVLRALLTHEPRVATVNLNIVER